MPNLSLGIGLASLPLSAAETDTGTRAFAKRAFKLASCRPSHTAVTVDSTDEFEAGRIKVDIWEVEDTGMSKAPNLKTSAPNSTGTDKKLPEGKKVWPTHSVVWGHLGLAVRRRTSHFATLVNTA
jgi:hypothetical protein